MMVGESGSSSKHKARHQPCWWGGGVASGQDVPIYAVQGTAVDRNGGDIQVFNCVILLYFLSWPNVPNHIIGVPRSFRCHCPILIFEVGIAQVNPNTS